MYIRLPFATRLAHFKHTDSMKKACQATYQILLWVVILTNGVAWAVSEKAQDDELLSLYFDEKQLVEASTHSLKPINYVAENVTIVTQKEIEAMHAHTLADVLKRQPGVFINYFGQDFLGTASILLQGSQRHHVLFLLDGVRLNQSSGGYAVTNFIPLGIIKRIEIIKGAASSTWGSALGGVVNIITKDTGDTPKPTGQVNASYAESNSYDLNADSAGKIERLSYYLYGGKLDSDGLAVDRYATRDALYGKLQFQLTPKSQLSFSGGYSDPFYKGLNWQNAWNIDQLNIYEDIDQKDIWGTVSLDTEIYKNTSLHLAVQHFDNTHNINIYSLGSGVGGGQGTLVYGQEWQDESTNFTSRISWAGESITTNIGFEINQSEMVYVNRLGAYFDGPTATTDAPVSEDRYGIYGNFTYVNGNLSLTPGIRYDDHSNSEESINPSLGATYQVTPDTLFRAMVAKGFSAPYLAASSHSPDLKPENLWTFQAGVETTIIPAIHFKGTLFQHNIDDAWENVVPWTNTGSSQLNGFEIEAITREFYGLSLTGNFTFTSYDIDETENSVSSDDETYTGNAILSYRIPTLGLRAELAGHYYWISDELQNESPVHGTFLWDLLIAKGFDYSGLSGELYIKGKNIFNESQYFDFEYPNPDRWVEIGITLKY